MMRGNGFLLTKSGFLRALECRKSFWYEVRQPERFPPPLPSLHERMPLEEGKAVHAAARAYVRTIYEDPQFEAAFTSQQGLHARLDALASDGRSIDLIEIKATTRPEEHLRDIAFQKVVVERAGARVGRCVVIHLDPDFRAAKGRDPTSLFSERDLTAEVAEITGAIEAEIDAILELLGQDRIDEAGCDCRYKGSITRRCAAFSHLNTDIIEPSVHILPHISSARLRRLDDDGRMDLSMLDEDDVTAAQLPHLRAFRTELPVINTSGIENYLRTLKWPLHFYDYETHARAMPVAEGHGPYMQVPVQFSLHILQRSGDLEHHEYLAEREGDECELVDRLARSIGPVGSLIAWNMSFEKGRNNVLAELVPTHREFLSQINERTRDLMVPFKSEYVHPGFAGSASIKKVLPVICPHLSYDADAVHDGAGAMQAWRQMISSSDASRRSDLALQLREYCKLDTFAMVEIHRHLEKVVGAD